MKIIGCGDLHTRERSPRNRTEGFAYIERIVGKLEWILSNMDEDSILIFPGDIFDSFMSGDYLKRILIKLFSPFKGRILTVPGQHDQRYHLSGKGSYDRIPLGVLEAAGVVKILSDVPLEIQDGRLIVRFYGTGWNEEIPEVEENEHYRNILIIHKMISDKDYWSGHLQYSEAKTFLRKSKFDLIVSGDNHNFFCEKDRGKIILNCGSIMRTRSDQLGHKPRIVIYNPFSQEIEIKEIPIEPSSKVFNISKIENEKEQSSSLANFALALGRIKDEELPEIDFVKNAVEMTSKMENLDPEVEAILWEAIPKREGKNG